MRLSRSDEFFTVVHKQNAMYARQARYDIWTPTYVTTEVRRWSLTPNPPARLTD